MGLGDRPAAPPERRPRQAMVALVLVPGFVLVVWAHQQVALLPLTASSRLLPLARLGDLLLVAGMLLLGFGLGSRVMRWLGIGSDGADGVAYASALGLGGVAYAVLVLGWVGLYRAPVFLVGLVGVAIAVRRDMLAGLRVVPATVRSVLLAARHAGLLSKLVGTLLLLAASQAVLGALTPPHHWDPLAYHLAVPQRYLWLGRIPPRGIPGVEWSNLPFTAELLYGIGLAFGSAVFGQLLHVAFAGLTGLALWGATRRHFDHHTAWLALAIFAGTPLVVVWARVANTDLALSCFLFLAVTAALRATNERSRGPDIGNRWLVLAGVFAGLALGSKYQAATAVVPLGLLVLWDAYRAGRSPGATARAGLSFGVAAALVAAPWYVKNLVALGNPVWPLLFGGRDFGPAKLELMNYWLRGMTLSPRTPVGYAFLPIRMYTRGDLEQPFVTLSPLVILAPLALLRARRREVTYMLVVSAAFTLAWAFGFQELRYLLPICAPLSLATAVALRGAAQRRFFGSLVPVGVLGATLLGLSLIVRHTGADRPFPFLFGTESEDAYLRASYTAAPSYRATTYLNSVAGPADKVLMFNEAGLFYAKFPAVPDQLNLNLILFTAANKDPAAALAALRASGVRYIYYNVLNIRYWSRYDPDGRLVAAEDIFAPVVPFLERVYIDGPDDAPLMLIYRVR